MVSFSYQKISPNQIIENKEINESDFQDGISLNNLSLLPQISKISLKEQNSPN